MALLKSTKGGLSQVPTGEGKSLIIAMFAAIKVMEGRQVDIITSTDVLAKRDAEDNKAFYELFDISVGYNTEDQEIGKAKPCYEKDIVYGDILNFNGDALQDITGNVRLGRGFDILMLDEFDYVGIDQNSMKIQLSRDIPYFDVLNQLLVYIWGQARSVRSMLQRHSDPTKCIYKTLLTEEQKNAVSPNQTVIKQGEHWVLLSEKEQDCSSIMKEELTNFTTTYLFDFDQHIKTKRLFVVPAHLEDFVKVHLQNWIRALSLSYVFEEGKDYILDKGLGHDLLQVTPVEIGNGVLLYNLQWSDGLHQFLQLKHAIAMTPENLVSIFMSYFGYLNKYKDRIYGATGTLGTKGHHMFLGNVYGVDLSIISAFAPKDLTKFPTIIEDTESEWQQAIIAEIWRVALYQNRPVLAVMDTIGEVEAIEKLLLQSGYNRSQAFTYGIGNNNAHEFNVKKPLNIRDVVLATNSAGRGTNIKLTSEALKNGGLHAIVSSFSRSVRPEDQIYGRPARQGAPGSIRRILCIERIKTDYVDYPDINNCINRIRANSEDIGCLEERRTEKEILGLNKEDLQIKLPNIKIMDDLFASYVELMKELDTPAGYQLSIGGQDNSKGSKYLYLYKDEIKIKLQIVIAGEIKDVVKEYSDITELIKGIDPHVAKHLYSILPNATSINNVASSLSKQDSELIHFIAANNGYRDIPGIYERIQEEFNEAAGKDEKPYLKKLLIKNPEFKDLQRSDNEIDDGLLKSVKLRKLFLLWLADRKVYNHEYEIMQLNENWGFWLRQYVDPLQLRAYQQADQQEWSSAKIEKQARDDFYNFKTKMLAEFKQANFIKNPAYKTLKAWRCLQIHYTHPPKPKSARQIGFFIKSVDQQEEPPLAVAERLLNETISSDEIYAANAYIARGYINVIKNGAGINKEKQFNEANAVNTGIYEDRVAAINHIRDVEIAGLEKQLTALSAHEAISIDSQLATNLLVGIEFYKVVAKALQKNMDDAIQAVKEKGIVRTTEVVDMDELTSGINVTAALQEFTKNSDLSASGKRTLDHINDALDYDGQQREMLDKIKRQFLGKGGILLKTEVYKLEKERKNWLGTIFSAVMGVVFICIGVLLAPIGGVFISVFATSLVAKGIGDIISSIMSVATGVPIDIGSYLKSAAISIGIAIVTAGVLSFMDHMMGGIQALDTFAGRVRDAGGNVIKTGVKIPLATPGEAMGDITKTALLHASTTVASLAAYDLVGRKMVDQGNIREKAASGFEEIISDCKEALRKIFATNKLELLYDKLNSIVDKYLDTFNSVGDQFATGVPVNTASYLVTGAPAAYGLGGLFQTGASLTEGMIKNSRAMPEIIRETKAAIREIAAQAPTSWAMMEKRFAAVFNKNNDASKLTAALISQEYILNGEIKYQDCSKLKEVNLNEVTLSDGSIDGYKNNMVDICNEIKDIFQKEYDYGALRSNFIDLTTGAITFIQKDIAHAGSQGFATVVVNLINKGIKEEQEKERWQQERDKRLAEQLDEQLTKNKNSYEKAAFAKNAYEPAVEEAMKNLRAEESKQTKTTPTKPHIVKEGESLSRIAEEFGSSVAELKRLNPEVADNPGFIKTGQVLKVPAAISGNYGGDVRGKARSSGQGDRTAGNSKNKDSNYLDKLWSENMEKYRQANGLSEDAASRFKDLFNEPIVKEPLTDSATRQSANPKDGVDSRFDQLWLKNIEEKYSAPKLFSREIFDGFWFETTADSKPNSKLDVFFENHPKLKSYFEHITDQALYENNKMKYEAGLSVGLGKNAFRTVEEISGFSWDVFQASMYVIAHPEEVINEKNLNKAAEFSWEALQWSMYAYEHPAEAVDFSIKVFKKAGAITGVWADSVWEHAQAKVDYISHCEDPFEAGLASADLVWDGISIVGLATSAGGAVIKGGGALLTSAAESGLIKGLNTLSEVDKIALVAKSEQLATKSELLGKLEGLSGSIEKASISKVNDIDNVKVRAFAKSLSEEISVGRGDYSKNFLPDLKNFQAGTSKLHHGKLQEDLYLVNIHDKDKKLVFNSNPGPDERTLQWGTHLEVYERTPEPKIEQLKQHLVLVYPEWGERNAATFIRIPAGTETTFISGKAMEQNSLKTGEKFIGGGFQVRLRDIDQNWIVETINLEKQK